MTSFAKLNPKYVGVEGSVQQKQHEYVAKIRDFSWMHEVDGGSVQPEQHEYVAK